MGKRRLSIEAELFGLGQPWRTWPQAEIVAMPARQVDGVKHLVRRRTGGLITSLDDEVVCFDGPPAISLFTGCGGMDLGLEQAGFCTAVQVEWCESACATLIGNRPNCFRNAALIQADIRKLPTWEILKAAGLYVGEAAVLCGGPPCQGFSTSNPKAWVNGYDARNDLVFEFLRVVREAQPESFVMENVPGFTRFNDGKYMERYLAAAYACGYELVYGLVDCVEYGVPQYRCRFICNGTRRDLAMIDGMLGALPEPECFGLDDTTRIELLRGLDGPEAAEEMRKLIRAPGIRYFPDRPVLYPPPPRGDEGRSKMFLRFYEHLERTEPDRIVRVPQHSRRAA